MQLAESQVARYGVGGYLSPLDALTRDQVSTYRQCYERLEDYLADLIAKTPPAQVTRLSKRAPGRSIHPTSLWIALSPSDEESGCMKVVRGTQNMGQLVHRDTFEEKNALTRGQEIEMEVDEADTVRLVFEPGQFSLHHIGVVHGSGPNRSLNPRIGFAVRYVAPEVSRDVEHSFAMLVRDEDRYGHFDLLEPPHDGSVDECVARGQQIIDRLYANLLPSSSAQD